MPTKFNLEADLTPVGVFSRQIAQTIVEDPHATQNEKRLALIFIEMARTIDKNIIELQTGMTCVIQDDRFRYGPLKPPSGSIGD